MLQADHLRAALQSQAVLPKDQAPISARVSAFLIAYFPVLECQIEGALPEKPEDLLCLEGLVWHANLLLSLRCARNNAQRRLASLAWQPLRQEIQKIPGIRMSTFGVLVFENRGRADEYAEDLFLPIRSQIAET